MKTTLNSLLLLIAWVVILWFGQWFFIPLVLGLFFWFFFMGIWEKVAHKLKIGNHKKALSIFLLIVSTLILLGLMAIAWTYIQENRGALAWSLSSSYEWLIQYLEKFSFISQTMLEEIPSKITSSFSFTSFNSFIWSTLWWVLNTILVFVYSILTIVYRKQLWVLCEILLPKSSKDTLVIVKDTVYSYAKWLLFLVLIMWVLYYIWLLVVGTPYALAIAWSASLLTLVPTVGTFIWGIWLVIATWLLTWSLRKAWVIFVWFLVIQQVEEFYILPKVVWKKVQLNVLATIISLVWRWLLRWVAWVFLAIPIMWVANSLLENTKSKRHKVMSV